MRIQLFPAQYRQPCRCCPALVEVGELLGWIGDRLACHDCCREAMYHDRRNNP